MSAAHERRMVPIDVEAFIRTRDAVSVDIQLRVAQQDPSATPAHTHRIVTDARA